MKVNNRQFLFFAIALINSLVSCAAFAASPTQNLPTPNPPTQNPPTPNPPTQNPPIPNKKVESTRKPQRNVQRGNSACCNPRYEYCIPPYSSSICR